MIEETLNKITEALGPAVSGQLGHAIVGLLILIIGLFIVKIVSKVITTGLKKVGFLYNTSKDGTSLDFASPIASLIKAVLTIFVLMAVLQHFGLTDVLAPLKDMVNKFTGAVPNIIGAGVIAYAGWIIAKIVSGLAEMALGKVDQQIAARTGNDEIKISELGSTFIFVIILLPIVVSALGVLNIPAISEPASAMIQKLMAAIPNIIGAGVILLVAYLVTKFVVHILSSLLDSININALPEKAGMDGIFTESFTVTKLIGITIMFFSMMAAATAAVNVLGIEVISLIFARVIEFGGGILVGSIILFIGNFLGNLAYKKLSSGSSADMANIARFAILGLVLAMGLKAMGLADNIVNMAFGFTLGSIAVAIALAFGFGGKDAAKAIADSWVSKRLKG